MATASCKVARKDGLVNMETLLSEHIQNYDPVSPKGENAYNYTLP